MKKNTIIFLLSSLICSILFISNASASNITIPDNRAGLWNGGDGTGYGGPGWWTRTTEDQEVEPGMIPTQVWDLEGFFLNNNKLSMVGGFDFKNGVSDGGHIYTSGSIFIDTTGDAQYGNFSGPAKTNYGYEYVVDLNFTTSTYTVYDGNWSWSQVYSYNTPYSNPWKYAGGETSVASGSFTYKSGLSDSDVGFSGGSHYAVEGIDLSFLPGGTTFIAHFTEECGNDNLIGGGTTVPEPSTLLFLGTGLLGLGFAIRRRKN